jgi:hypothetical protein
MRRLRNFQCRTPAHIWFIVKRPFHVTSRPTARRNGTCVANLIEDCRRHFPFIICRRRLGALRRNGDVKQRNVTRAIPFQQVLIYISIYISQRAITKMLYLSARTFDFLSS